MVAVPDFAPAVAVFSPTTRLVLLVAPGARLVNEPVAVMTELAVPIDPLSPSAGAVARLAIESACVAVSPTRRFPKLTGLGVAVPAWARLPTTPVMTPLRPIVWVGSG